MSDPIFDLIPIAFGANLVSDYKINEVKFGDGYSARAKPGLNSVRQRWTVNWKNLTEAEFAQLKAFFDEKAGVSNFDYTPRGQTTALKFVCRKFNGREITYGHWSASATFEQDFANN